MSRPALSALLGCGCFAVSDLPFEEPCRQARLAAVTRVWECTHDTAEAEATDHAFEQAYTCRITGWGAEGLDSGFELGKQITLEEGGSMAFPDALGCGEGVRAVDCAVAVEPLSTGWVLEASPACAAILDGPGATTAGSTGEDLDQDGFTAGVDCDDSTSLIHPGAYDWAGDGIDSDCDGADD